MDTAKAVHAITEEVLARKVDFSNFSEMTLEEVGINSMNLIIILSKIEEYTQSDMSSIFGEMEPPKSISDLIQLYNNLTQSIA